MGIQNRYKTKYGIRNKNLRLLAMGMILLVCFLASFAFGRYPVNPGDVLKILLSRIIPIRPTWSREMETTVLNIRFPRICMACAVGCALAAAGVSYQGVFQNPMAAPDLLGASGGAGFGAALAIVMGFSSGAVVLCAFTASILTVVVVFLVAQRAQGKKAVNLILAGIMIGSLCTAGTSYLKLIADPGNQLPQITYWLMGSLSGVKNSDLPFTLCLMLAGLLPLFLLRWRINLLTLGDEEAQSLGVNPNLLRLAIVLCSTLVTAAAVSVSGVIGWVGLVIPHICRKLVGSDYRFLMPASFLGGATFLLLVDGLSRNLFSVELPVGILSAVIGAPFFLYLICRKEKTL